MGSFIARTLEASGYLGLVFLMFVENIFPPIPSELIMPFAGYLASQEKFVLWGVIVAGTLGSVLGALPLYALGKKIGAERMRRVAARHGRWLALSPRDIDRAERWFARHGNKAVFFCRLVPGVRSLISIPAGIHGLPLGAFLFYTTAGSAIWTTLLASVGFYLGSRFERVEQWLDPVSNVVIGAIVVLYAYRVITHKGHAAAKPRA